MTAQGRVVAVCRRSSRGIPKEPQAQVQVGLSGVEGDFHARPYDRHKKRGPREPNRRQVTLVATEALGAVNSSLGTRLKPGDLGENILLEGLGDLSGLVAGDRITLGERVVLEVTGQNRPCSTLSVHHPKMVNALVGRRGVTAVVVQTGTVQPGDRVEVLRSPA